MRLGNPNTIVWPANRQYLIYHRPLPKNLIQQTGQADARLVQA